MALRPLAALFPLLFPLLAACTQTSGPSLNQRYGGVPPPLEGLGRIYVYRDDFPLFPAVAPDVIVNGQKVGEAAFASLFYRDAAPGRYEAFLTSDEENPVYFYLAAGQSRFLKAVIDLRITGTKIGLELVPEAQGREESADLNTENGEAGDGETGDGETGDAETGDGETLVGSQGTAE